MFNFVFYSIHKNLLQFVFIFSDGLIWVFLGASLGKDGFGFGVHAASFFLMAFRDHFPFIEDFLERTVYIMPYLHLPTTFEFSDIFSNVAEREWRTVKSIFALRHSDIRLFFH